MNIRMEAATAAALHLWLDGVAIPVVEKGDSADLLAELVDARRALHGALRGEGYILNDVGWVAAPTTGRRR